jgi:ribose transport system permease protein
MVLAGIIGGVIGLIGNTISPILGYTLMFITCVIVSMLLGFINGITYIKLRIPSMIATVGLLMIYEILGVWIPGTKGVGVSLYDKLSFFGRPPYNIIIGLLSMLLAYFLYNYSRIGIHIRAIGKNELMAKNMGVKTEQTKIFGFIIAGLFVGINSVMTISYSSMMIPQTGLSSLQRIFTPLMGCFFGIVFRKYINPIISILIGEFTMIMIVTGLMTVNIDATIQKIVIGAFLLVVAGATVKQKTEGVVK